MGIIKAFTGAAGGVMADQWLEMYYCDSVPKGVLAVRGVKHTSERSSNTKGNENVISDGSVIVINEGQAAIAVEQGKVIGVFTQPGENIFHGGSASLFSGNGTKGIGKEIFRRVGFGGDVAIHQYILYINMKEIPANPFSASFPIVVTDEETDWQLTATVRASGVFSFRVTDPVSFYQKICRGANGTVMARDVLPQLQAEFTSAMIEASAKLFAGSLRLSDMPGKVNQMNDAVSECMTEKWVGLRGFTVVSMAMDHLTVYDRDMRVIQTMQRDKMLRDPAMAAATLTGAQAQAMTDAATNENGGFVAVGAVPPPAAVNPGPLPNVTAAPKTQPVTNLFLAPDDPDKPKLWYCPNCNKYLTSKFCPDCGAKRKT